jgi:hypothetical protein
VASRMKQTKAKTIAMILLSRVSMLYHESYVHEKAVWLTSDTETQSYP